MYEGISVTEEHMGMARRIARRSIRTSSADDWEDYVSVGALAVAKADAAGADYPLQWVIGRRAMIDSWRTYHKRNTNRRYPQPEKVSYNEEYDPPYIDDISLTEVDVKYILRLAELDTITLRDIKILQLLSYGMTDQDAAKEMKLTYSTLKSYRKGIVQRFGARNTIHAVAIALRAGIIK